MNENGSEVNGRRMARLGHLSIRCFFGGLGLAFVLFCVGLRVGGSLGHIGMAIALGLAAMALAISAVFGVMGVIRRERPLVPAVVGCFLVAGLLAILFLTPAPGGPRDKAVRANCLSNQKQILIAMAMYADNYGGRYPMDSANPTLVGSMKLLSNYLGSANLFHCPRDHRPGARAATDYQSLTTLNISYSYVPNLKWQDTPDSPVILDRIYSTTNGSTWLGTGNHGDKGGIVGFNDGHVQWCNALPAALKDKDGKQVVLSP